MLLTIFEISAWPLIMLDGLNISCNWSQCGDQRIGITVCKSFYYVELWTTWCRHYSAKIIHNTEIQKQETMKKEHVVAMLRIPDSRIWNWTKNKLTHTLITLTTCLKETIYKLIFFKHLFSGWFFCACIELFWWFTFSISFFFKHFSFF